MSFRSRIGPFTFGSSGIRLSLWSGGSGVSVPLTGEGRTFGKVKVGPVSKYFQGSGRSKHWRDDPATEKQKNYASSLGIRYPKHVTKGELSDLIARAKGKSA